MMAIVSCNYKTEQHVNDEPISTAPAEAMTEDLNVEVDNLDDFEMIDIGSEEMLNKCFARSTCVRSESRINGRHLIKIWKVDGKVAHRTIDVTTQRCVRSKDPSINRENNTNDRMLKCDQIGTHFLMCALFATRKSMESTKSSTRFYFFVTDNSFTHIEPLMKRSDLIDMLESFSKKVGISEVIIVNGAPEENSTEVKKF